MKEFTLKLNPTPATDSLRKLVSSNTHHISAIAIHPGLEVASVANGVCLLYTEDSMGVVALESLIGELGSTGTVIVTNDNELMYTPIVPSVCRYSAGVELAVLNRLASLETGNLIQLKDNILIEVAGTQSKASSEEVLSGVDNLRYINELLAPPINLTPVLPTGTKVFEMRLDGGVIKVKGDEGEFTLVKAQSGEFKELYAVYTSPEGFRVILPNSIAGLLLFLTAMDGYLRKVPRIEYVLELVKPQVVDLLVTPTNRIDTDMDNLVTKLTQWGISIGSHGTTLESPTYIQIALTNYIEGGTRSQRNLWIGGR